MYTCAPEQLLRLHKPAPRYTSYPPAPAWEEVSPKEYRNALCALKTRGTPAGVYIHIPFCRSMCLYCGCSVVLNRKPERTQEYVRFLCQEIALLSQELGKGYPLAQLHMGGGTPTQLSVEDFISLFEALHAHFSLHAIQEIALEVDPRTVVEDSGSKLRLLRQLGVNRISFGVQDTDPKVQEAVKRRQSWEMTQETYAYARRLGFTGINIDLIYGLPYQTRKTFEKTVTDILSLQPDRIAFFSYAKVPWLKPHQKAIREETLPTPEEKFAIYADARQRFQEAGYIAIGMDHFARETDEMAHHFHAGTLTRNFQGYTIPYSPDLIGLGMTAIGSVGTLYAQNAKTLTDYYQALTAGDFPIIRGKSLSQDDICRRWVIHQLLCTFKIDKKAFSLLYGVPFDLYFAEAAPQLASLETEGLVQQDAESLWTTPLGTLFSRIVAMAFDVYLPREVSSPQFSQSI